MSPNSVDRREFIKVSASTAIGAAVVSAGASDAQSAGQSPIRVGTIGCGGMGNAHLQAMLRLKQAGEPVEVVGVCDVYQVRLNAAADLTGAKAYRYYKDLLANDAIDAVSIATPDHWHAQIAIDALRTGKDVYCEKPMTYWGDLGEAKRVAQAVEENGRVLQVGTQGTSDDIWEIAGARIRDGALGPLVHAQASDMRNGGIGVYSPLANDGQADPKRNLDWDMWLGSAPARDWDPGRFFAFRSFWDYSGGTGTDFFPHILTPMVKAMGLGFPHRVTASGGLYAWEDGREVPDIFTVMIEYPGGPSLMLVGALSTDSRLPMVIRGGNATMTFEGPGAVIAPQASAGDAAKPEELARTRGGSLDEHWRDFLHCVRTRQTPRSDVQTGYHVMAALHMGIRSYRTGRTMEFDPNKETVRPM